MRILIVNDDGIFAQGIMCLAEALHIEHQIIVIAPDKECSGESHKLNFVLPIAYKKVDAIKGCECYQIHGSPCDAAKFGIEYLLESPPDLLISGINNGENVGTDLVYSGTVHAAIEGAINGIKSIAVSIAGRKNKFEHCAQFVANNLDRLMSLTMGYDTVININFPACDKGETKGVKVCKVGARVFEDDYQSVPTRYEGYDNSYMLTGVPRPLDKELADCDVSALEHGYITISPVKIDFTNHEVLSQIENTKFEL